jgi:hypothetical protein
MYFLRAYGTFLHQRRRISKLWIAALRYAYTCVFVLTLYNEGKRVLDILS